MCAHIHMHSCTPISTRAHTCTHAHTLHICAPIHMYSCICVPVHMHIHTSVYRCLYTCVHIHVCIHILIHECKPSLAHSMIGTHTAHVHSCTHIHMHTHTYTHICTHVHPHTHTHNRPAWILSRASMGLGHALHAGGSPAQPKGIHSAAFEPRALSPRCQQGGAFSQLLPETQTRWPLHSSRGTSVHDSNVG